MTNQTRVITPYVQPNAAAGGHAHASVGDININVGSPSSQNTQPQIIHVYAAEETHSKSFSNIGSGLLTSVAALAIVGAAVDFAVNKEDSLAAKAFAPDINNTTVQAPPATRVNNYIRPQTDGSTMRKMQEAIDSLKANGQEVLLLPPSAADTVAAAPAIPRDTVPGFKPVGM